MIFTQDTTNKRVTISFTDAEWDILKWALATYGATTARDWLKQHLREQWATREAQRLATLKQTVPPDLV